MSAPYGQAAATSDPGTGIPGWPGPVLRFSSLGSTQTTARRLAERGYPEWTLVLADRQARGRGRLRRTWDSKAGGLYFSIILRPGFPPAALAALSSATALALARSLAEASGLPVKIKPPNDILAAPAVNRPMATPESARGSSVAKKNFGASAPWRKVCGILIEASGDSTRIDWVIVGIGVNVNNKVATTLRRASSLSALLGRPLGRNEILRKILSEFRRIYQLWPAIVSATASPQPPSGRGTGQRPRKYHETA